MLVDVARAQKTESRVPAVPEPVACGLFKTALNPCGSESVIASPPALSTKRRARSSTACVGHAGLTAPVPMTAVPANL